jgi:hypothetical protein
VTEIVDGAAEVSGHHEAVVARRLQLREKRVRFGPRREGAEEHAIEPAIGRERDLRRGLKCHPEPLGELAGGLLLQERSRLDLEEAGGGGALRAQRDRALKELRPLGRSDDPDRPGRSRHEFRQVALHADPVQHSGKRDGCGGRDVHRRDRQRRLDRRWERRGRRRGRGAGERPRQAEQRQAGEEARGPRFQNRDRIRVPRTSLRKSLPRRDTIRHIS